LHYKKTKDTTHQICRSLLQKAIRRGYEGLAKKTAYHLINIGDKPWVRSRCVVICAEECFPFLRDFVYSTDEGEILSNVSLLSRLEKNKTAAGLGALGYALSEGDETVLKGQDNNLPIRIIANAIERTDDYWKWLLSISKTNEQRTIVKNLILLHRKAGWPWDKAFILSAGYLFLHERLKVVKIVNKQIDEEFPYWIAMDKHTSEGKNAIRDTANDMNLPVRQLGWISFYLESGLTCNSQPAYWWDREKNWRLNKVGVDFSQAEEIWKKAKIIISERLREESENLKEHINQQDIVIQNSFL
jgi:hypothetical protein